MSKKGGIIGGIISIVIGSVVYNINQQQIVDNFAKDTGMSQQEAKSYVEKTLDDDLVLSE